MWTHTIIVQQQHQLPLPIATAYLHTCLNKTPQAPDTTAIAALQDLYLPPNKAARELILHPQVMETLSSVYQVTTEVFTRPPYFSPSVPHHITAPDRQCLTHPTTVSYPWEIAPDRTLAGITTASDPAILTLIPRLTPSTNLILLVVGPFPPASQTSSLKSPLNLP